MVNFHILIHLGFSGYRVSYLELNFGEFGFRPRCGSDSVIAENAHGDESIRVRDLQQRVSKRSESSAT